MFLGINLEGAKRCQHLLFTMGGEVRPQLSPNRVRDTHSVTYVLIVIGKMPDRMFSSLSLMVGMAGGT